MDTCKNCSKTKPCGCGRVTDYNSTILQAAKGYLLNYAKMGDVVPTIEGLADELGRGVKTIYNWSDANPEFEDVLKQILARQGRLLQNKGLKKETDASITKLLLSANHGKAEKSEQKLSGGVSLSSALNAADEQ